MRRSNRRTPARLTERQRRFLMYEERKASRDYGRLGFRGMSRDEARHADAIRRNRGY